MVTFLDNKARYKLISGLPTKESVTGEIQLPEDDPVAVEKNDTIHVHAGLFSSRKRG